jgi:hypothetical protein
LGWNNFYDKINDFLLPFSGQQNVSLGESAFAEAVAIWQSRQGFAAKNADGIIGPATWSILKPFILAAAVHPQNNPSVLPPVNTGTAAPLQNALGKLMIDTSVPVLSKSYAQYQFTADDALWLARFVEGEAGGKDNADSHAVMWAMFNRFGILRHKVPSWSSFQVFLRKYSTTLQPLLNSAGAAERVWNNYRTNPEKYPVVSSEETYTGTSIKKVQYVKHIKLQHKEWAEFPSYVQNMVLKILSGQIPNPQIGIATDFASTYVFLKSARHKQGISGEPTHEEWQQYTLKYARDKKLIWIGDKPNLDQLKNAFFIQQYLKDVSPGSVKII